MFTLTWPHPICKGIIAISINGPHEKGSMTFYRVHSVFTLMNVLIIQLSLWPCVLKRWFFMLRDEMEFDEVVRWMSLHMLKQKQRYNCLSIKQFSSLTYTYSIKTLSESEISVKTLHNYICLPSSLLPTKVQVLSVMCNQLMPNRICWPQYK